MLCLTSGARPCGHEASGIRSHCPQLWPLTTDHQVTTLPCRHISHMSHMSHVSHIACHISNVTYHMSHITYHMSHMSHCRMCRISHVSYIKCDTKQVMMRSGHHYQVTLSAVVVTEYCCSATFKTHFTLLYVTCHKSQICHKLNCHTVSHEVTYCLHLWRQNNVALSHITFVTFHKCHMTHIVKCYRWPHSVMFLDTQVSLTPTHVSLLVRWSVSPFVCDIFLNLHCSWTFLCNSRLGWPPEDCQWQFATITWKVVTISKEIGTITKEVATISMPVLSLVYCQQSILYCLWSARRSNPWPKWVSAAHEMHSPTMWNTKLRLSWNLFGPPPGIEPGSLRLAAIHSNH